MNALTLSELEQAGIIATAAGGKLRLSAPAGRLTADLRERVAEHRDELLNELAELQALCDVQRERERMDRGLPPLAWGDPAPRICTGCGPVLLWLTSPDLVTACPWCFRRKVGKAIARFGHTKDIGCD